MTQTCRNCGHDQFRLREKRYKLFNDSKPLVINQVECCKCGEVAATIKQGE